MTDVDKGKESQKMLQRETRKHFENELSGFELLMFFF